MPQVATKPQSLRVDVKAYGPTEMPVLTLHGAEEVARLAGWLDWLWRRTAGAAQGADEPVTKKMRLTDADGNRVELRAEITSVASKG